MHQDMIKHLEFIQAVIARLAGNSFLLKGWATTLAAAGFGLVATNTAPWYVLAAVLFATTTLWALDAFYLRQERLFRELFDAVRVASYQEWEMMGRFSMSTQPYDHAVASWFFTLFARTIAVLYGGIILATIIVGFVLIRCN
jgi:hypothetical protein